MTSCERILKLARFCSATMGRAKALFTRLPLEHKDMRVCPGKREKLEVVPQDREMRGYPWRKKINERPTWKIDK